MSDTSGIVIPNSGVPILHINYMLIILRVKKFEAAEVSEARQVLAK